VTLWLEHRLSKRKVGGLNLGAALMHDTYQYPSELAGAAQLRVRGEKQNVRRVGRASF
jgi:hypothetical protein